MSSDLGEVKSTIRALMVSDPLKCRTINDLCYLYKELEGEEVPFRKFNCRNALEFLLLMPDAVKVSDRNNRNSGIFPVITQQSKHVYDLVCNQRRPPPSRRRFQNRQPFSPRPARSNYQPHRNTGSDYAARPRPQLTDEFKRDVYKLLINYPEGLDYENFRSHVSRLLENHYLSEYRVGEVLNDISEFAFLSSGKVYLLKSSNQDRRKDEEHDREVADLCSNGSDYGDFGDKESEYDDDDEDMPSVSRSASRCASRKYSPDGASDNPLCSRNLRNNLHALFDEPENRNGIWLMKLKETYQKKFFYPLSAEEHGFRNLMEMVANLPDIFTSKRYRVEGDLLLLDARKHPQTTDDSTAEKGEIPISLLEKLKRLLKQEKQIYTEDLPSAYKRMYQQTLKPEDHGFKNMDAFLKHLEETCRDSIRFRQIVDRTVIKLQYEQIESVKKRDADHESALPNVPTYNPFPPNVCDADFRLEADPIFEEVKEGDTFEVNLGEVYSPSRFYITHIKRAPLLSQLMNDMNDFYDCNESKYEILPSVLERNLMCACRYSKTCEWHRVRVMSGNIDKVKVSFVDYGTVEEVDTRKLRYLHEDFAKVPTLCILARLSGIQPKDGDVYSDAVKDAFFQMYRNVDLEVEIVQKREKSLEVNLFAVSSEGRILVQDQLIARCYVAPKIEEVVQKPPTSLPAEELHSPLVQPAPIESPDLGLSSMSITKRTLPNRATSTSKDEDTRHMGNGNTIAFFNRMVTDRTLKEKVKSKVQQQEKENHIMLMLRNDEPQNQNSIVQEPLEVVQKQHRMFPFLSSQPPPPPFKPLPLPTQSLPVHNMQVPYQAPYDHHPSYNSPYPSFPPGIPISSNFFQYPNYQFPTGGSLMERNYLYDTSNPVAANYRFQSAPSNFAAPHFSASTAIPSTSYLSNSTSYSSTPSSYSSTPSSYRPYLSRTTARVHRPPPGFDVLPSCLDRCVSKDEVSPRSLPISVQPKPISAQPEPIPALAKPLRPEIVSADAKKYVEQVVEETLRKLVRKSEELKASGKTVEEVERALFSMRNLDGDSLEFSDPVKKCQQGSGESAKPNEFYSVHPSEFVPKTITKPYVAQNTEERADFVTSLGELTANNQSPSSLKSAAASTFKNASVSTPTPTVKETGENKLSAIRAFVLKQSRKFD